MTAPRTAAFHLYGVGLSRQTACDALDGVTVFEAATNLPVQRWRTQRDVAPSLDLSTTAAAIRRRPAGKRLRPTYDPTGGVA